MSKEYNCSPSKLSSAESCELKFYLQYVKHVKIEGYVYPAMVMGTVFHKVVELMYVRHKYQEQDLFGFIDEAWALAMKDPRNKLRPDHATPEKVLEHKLRVKSLLKRFYKHHTEAKLIGVNPAGVEQSVKIPWVTSKGDTVILNGYIDRIMVHNNIAWVTDWKTSKDISTQKEVDNNMQLTFYSAFYRYLAKNKLGSDKWPKIEEYLELFFPVYGQSVKTIRTKEHFEDMKARVEKVIEIEKGQKKKAMVSEEACRWCAFKGTTYCPETMGGIKL